MFAWFKYFQNILMRIFIACIVITNINILVFNKITLIILKKNYDFYSFQQVF